MFYAVIEEPIFQNNAQHHSIATVLLNISYVSINNFSRQQQSNLMLPTFNDYLTVYLVVVLGTAVARKKT